MLYLNIAQIFIAIIFSLLVLFQQRGTALGSAFGGSSESYLSRRGAEKKIFWLTIFFSILLVLSSILNILY
jgi:protein translocase SecG subunit